MASLSNEVRLYGRLGADAEVKNTGNSVLITFSLATSDTWKDKDGNKKEKTTWHQCKMWFTSENKIHTILKKGNQIALRGAIENSTWEKDVKGEKVTMHSSAIVVDEIDLISSVESKEKATEAAATL